MQILFKSLYVIAFCALMIRSVSAQNVDSLYYCSQSVRSVGCGFPALNYSLLSSLNHSGYSLSFHSTRFRENPKHLNQYQMHSELGILYNNANDSYITTLGFNGGWTRHWFLSDRSRPLRLLAGGGADAGINVYLKDDNTNNPLAYFFNLSLNPNLLLKYRFHLKQTSLELGQQIDIPLVSLISSSGYSSTLPYGFIEEDASFFEVLRLVSFGSLNKCVAITTLDITPSQERRQKRPAIRISYVFSGMKYSNGDFTIKSVDHLIFLGTIFHLFR